MAGAPLNVAVIGCGIGGQAAALFLGEAGHDVTIFEQFDTPKALGAGLLLQPTGQEMLRRLNLLGHIQTAGAAVHRLFGTNVTGRTVLDLAYRDYRNDWCGIGIHRGVLFSTLHARVSASNIHLSTDSFVNEIQDGDHEPRVVLSSGEVGPFDLVVVAEGGSPTLLPETWVRTTSVPYPWGAYWTLCPDPDNRFPHTLRQIYRDADVMIGVLPIGQHPDFPQATRFVSVFWSIRTQDMDRCRRDGLTAWKQDVMSYWPQADYFLDAITSFDQLVPAAYRDIVMWPYNRGRVVYIGDAAHCTSPQLGQGANLALVDAYVLSETLKEGARSGDGVPETLTRYSRRRRSHIAYYQLASRALTPFFQSSHRALALLRDAFMGPICKVPPARSMMLRTLSGVQQGLFGTFPHAYGLQDTGAD